MRMSLTPYSRANWCLSVSYTHLDVYKRQGQAPSYKVGERLWLQLRDEVRQREGAAFDLKAFHRRALDIGGVGLDTLRRAVLC